MANKGEYQETKNVNDVVLIYPIDIEEETMWFFNIYGGSWGLRESVEDLWNTSIFLDRGMTKDEIIINKLLIGMGWIIVQGDTF